jgi:hypothetical protein
VVAVAVQQRTELPELVVLPEPVTLQRQVKPGLLVLQRLI